MMVSNEIFSYDERISVNDLHEVTAMSLGDVIYAVVDMAEKGFTPVLEDKSATFPIRHGNSHTVFFKVAVASPEEVDAPSEPQCITGNKTVLGTDTPAPDWEIFENIQKKSKLKEFAKVFDIDLKDASLKVMKAQFEKEYSMRD